MGTEGVPISITKDFLDRDVSIEISYTIEKSTRDPNIRNGNKMTLKPI